MLTIDNIELQDWAVNNKFVRFLYCRDLRKCSILKIAIEKAIHKSPHDVQQRHLFPEKDDGKENQFLSFVSSHRTGNVLNSLHITVLLSFIPMKRKAQLSRAF